MESLEMQLQRLREMIAPENEAAAEQVDKILAEADPEQMEFAINMLNASYNVNTWASLGPFALYKAYDDAMAADIAKQKAERKAAEEQK